MKSRSLPLLAFACALAALLVPASIASAAAPANDALANAIPLTIDQTENGTTLDAVDEGEQVSGLGWELNNTVWYTYTPATTGLFKLDVCAAFGVNVVVMTGAASPFDRASTNPPSYIQQYSTQSDCAGGAGSNYATSVGPFLSTAGVELKVQISSAYGSGAGPEHVGEFEITPSFTPAPANDNFANAAALTDDALTSGTNVGSTVEIGENPPEIGGWGLYNTVWYGYTAPSNGELSVELCSQFGHNLFAAFGSLGSFTLAGSYPLAALQRYSPPRDCGYGDYGSTMSLPITSGQTVWINVGSAFTGIENQGTFRIRATLRTQPANDQLSGAVDLGSGADASQVGHNYATDLFGSGEPQIDGQSRPKMVWYRWTAPIAGSATVDTCDTWGNLSVGVFNSDLADPSLGDLEAVVGDTDGCSVGRGARVGFTTEVGRSYWIAVASDGQYNFNEGRFTLKVHAKPANDDWADATDLGNADTVSVDASSVNATMDYNPDTFEATGPMIGGQYRSSSVWFKWTAPRDSYYYVDTCSGSPSGYDGFMSVYRKDGDVPPYHNLLVHATGDDECSGDRPSMPKTSFLGTAGQTYWIAVAAYTTNADGGTDFTLKISSPPAPTSQPVISGASLLEGAELSTSDGNWGGTGPISFEYRWTRCDGDGFNCVDIAGAEENTYELVSADVGHTIRSRAVASNAFGGDYSESSATGMIVADVDHDGVSDVEDDCPSDAQGVGKTNGCPVEGVSIDIEPSITGTAKVGSTLTATKGAAMNSPGIDLSVSQPTGSINWLSCPAVDTPADQCDGRGSGSTTFQPTDDDIERFIRVQVVWTNGDSQQQLPVTAPTAAVFKDTDDDGVHDADDSCPTVSAGGSEKANGCPLEPVGITTAASLSGKSKSGHKLTLDDGAAANSGDDSSVMAPSVVMRAWSVCPLPLDIPNCPVMGGTNGNEYTPTDADVGKVVVATVIWSNGEQSTNSQAVSGVVEAADVTPGTPNPLDLSALKFPKKASAKKLVKSKGKFTIKTIQIACPVGGADCKIAMSYTAKVKRKTKKLGSSTLTVPAGQTKPLSGKLSSSGLKLLKANSKLKVTIAMKGSGGGSGKATLKEFTVTR